MKTDAFEEAERSVVRVKYHLLRLARIGAHEQHPAVAQPDVRHLHRHGRAVGSPSAPRCWKPPQRCLPPDASGDVVGFKEHSGDDRTGRIVCNPVPATFDP
jgi:hypothetical protein